MLGELLGGLFAYNSYVKEKERQNSFQVNNTKNYKKFGTYNLICPNDKMVKILIDGYLFTKLQPYGGKGVHLERIKNLPIGSKMSIVIVPLIGAEQIEAEFILEEKMCVFVYNEMQGDEEEYD